MPTVSYGIASTADDVCDFTAFTGLVDVEYSASGLYAGFGASCPGGLRFLGVNVPQGSTITSASLVLKKDAANSQPGPWGALKGVAVDSASTWSTTRPGLATKTTQAVTIIDGATQTYDVATIVQAIVNRAGWTSGNALAFVGDTTDAAGIMVWLDYSTSPTDCAQLSITYSAGGPDVTAPTITSDDTPSVVEGSTLSHALTANETVTWTKVGGADAAAFTLTGSTLSLPAQTYPGGPFVAVVRATDAAGNWTEQTITVSVTAAPPISFVGSATGTTTATMPAHQAGDLILCWAYRDGSNTLPTLASAGWTSLDGVTGANTNSARLVGKIATSSAEAVGTFTSATSVVVAVYRPKAGYTLSLGAVAATTGASTTVSYPALTLQAADGSSWVAGFAGHRSVNTTLETPPTGMVNRATVLDATDEAAAHDTNGGVSAWTAQSASVGGTSSGWRAATVEIKATLAGAARPTFQAFIIG